MKNDTHLLMIQKSNDKIFTLDKEFIESYENKNPKNGMDILGLVTFYRTYSRMLEKEERNEHWFECVRRVVEGVMNIQKEYCMNHRRKWSDIKAQRIAQIMYDKMFNFKMIPPGRGLWIMGSSFIKERGAAALNNCAYISTENIGDPKESSMCFAWTMDMLMLGSGVSSDTRGAGKVVIKQPKPTVKVYTIPDSREGWVNSLWMLMESYFQGTESVDFNYSLIRERGLPIKGFGGTASGPDPLKILHNFIRELFNKRIGLTLSSVDIVDIMNNIGRCVVSGNVRRSSCLMLGDPDDTEFVTMKDPVLHKEELISHRWASNNSVNAVPGKIRYEDYIDSICANGEPGFVWLSNIRKHGRMMDPVDDVDINVGNLNPCFTGDMKLLTKDGYVTFDQLDDIGCEVDIVRKDGSIGPAQIIYTGKKIIAEIYVAGVEEPLKCTHDHVWMLSNGTECKAINLQGKTLKNYSYMKTRPIVTKVVLKNDEEDVFDFKEPKFHWGIVNNFFAHNCGEICLESGGMCNLVSVIPAYHDTYDEFEESLKYAYMYAKTVTLLDTGWPNTDEIIRNTRRIGISLSGVIDAFEKHGRDKMLKWCRDGYNYVRKLDKEYSEHWLHIPESSRISALKPDGTTSLLTGSSPGIHYPFDKYYIRRVRIDSSSPICKILTEHGYHYEVERENFVFEFPVMKEHFGKSVQTCTVEDQFRNASDMQEMWADNSVSITITFRHQIKRNEKGEPIDENNNVITSGNPKDYIVLESDKDEVVRCLYKYENRLKAVSLLPDDPFAYALMPFESITKEKFDRMWEKITPINFKEINIYQKPEVIERFCTKDSCDIIKP